MFNYDRIMATILATPGILNLLDDDGVNKAIYGDNKIPKTFSGDESINFYHNAPIDATLEYDNEVYTINCRSKTFKGARTMQSAVKDGFNRKASQNDGFYKVTVLPIIPPKDETDNYNGVISLRFRKR